MISIHQSQFLSWIPYFYKVLKSDNFVVLDDVQFQKNGVQNRNMIKTPQGQSWITLPVKHNLDTPINEVLVSNINVYEKLLKTLELNYKKSKYFDQVYDLLAKIILNSHNNLNELNNSLLMGILKTLEADINIDYSSNLNTIHKKDDLVIEIIKKVGDYEYLSGSGALSYMDLEKFKAENIKVYVYKFNQEPYTQLWDKQVGFVKDLSVIDLLFNELETAREYILRSGNISRVI